METYVKTNGTASCGIADNVGADVSVRHGTENHACAGNHEASTVQNMLCFSGEEHGVAGDDSWGGQDDEDLSLVGPPTDGREEDSENGTHGVGRDTVELLLDDGVIGVDVADDGGKEEGEALDGDIVEEEDEGDLESDRVGNTAQELGSVDAVNDFGLGKTLRLDSGDAKLLLLLGEPAGGLGSVGEGEEGDEAQGNSDDALDGEDHSPLVEAAKVVESENGAGQETTKGTSQRSHDHVERQAECQLRALVPTGEVVCDTGQHASFEDTEKEADTTDGALGVDESSGDTDDAKGQRGSREEPAGTHPFAGDGGGNLEDDV